MKDSGQGDLTGENQGDYTGDIAGSRREAIIPIVPGFAKRVEEIMTENTSTITSSEPTLNTLRTQAVRVLGISKNAAKKLSRADLVAKITEALEGVEGSTPEQEVEVVESGAAKTARVAPKRPVKFTFTLADGKTSHANFTTVEAATEWGQKAKEAGKVTSFEVIPAESLLAE